MKVYILIKDYYYEGYDIVGVYLVKSAANAECERRNKAPKDSNIEYAVSEFDVTLPEN